MRKTAKSIDLTKLNYVHSNNSAQPYRKGLATFKSCMPSNENNRLTPCHDQILQQACSTTFTSKIFQFSNCQSKETSSPITVANSQTEIQTKKRKINVTTSLVKIKTQTSQPLNQKLMPTFHQLQSKKEMGQSYKKISSTNHKNIKCVTSINPEKQSQQKQNILKKLNGKKKTEITSPYTQNIHQKYNQKLYTRVFERTEQNDYENSSPSKSNLKHNCSLLRSEKKINHMKKRNLNLESEENQTQNHRQKIKTQADGSWMVLMQNTDFSSWHNKMESVETPINRLLDEEEQNMFFKKPNLSHDK